MCQTGKGIQLKKDFMLFQPIITVFYPAILIMKRFPKEIMFQIRMCQTGKGIQLKKDFMLFQPIITVFYQVPWKNHFPHQNSRASLKSVLYDVYDD